MPKKGEKLSDEHRAKMAEGRRKKRESGLKTAPPKTEIIANQLPSAPVNPATVAHKTVENPEANPVVDRKGVESSGLTKKVEAQQFIMNSNLGPSSAITAQLPGQAEQIKKSLKVKVPKLAPVEPKPVETTVAKLKTDDPKAIEARAPFSFNALRLRLRT
jgi:hypothetical protein